MSPKNPKRRGERLRERSRPLRRRLGRRPPQGILLKSPEEIAMLRQAGGLVAECFARLAASIAPGLRLIDLDAEVTELILARGAEPLYKGYRGNPPDHPPFPGVICASVNQEICHGIPDARVLEAGDIVGIDIGLRYQGWCGDACVTFPVGAVSEAASRLMRVAEEAMYRGIAAAQPGNRLYDIGEAVQVHAEAAGYSVVRDWGGHGLGRSLHEPPSVPHTGDRENDLVLREGMVFTVEPMINAGAADCLLTEDGWTVVTEDGQLSAQFEHTLAVTADGPLILSPWHLAMGRTAG
ncbi:MAG: type I methionyl aminopeptidase [Caldilineae bacterium]|nr:type I methionyl aminopeptidase [Chloroflexota bacterium]MCB9177299.1 type I methionyl aminopeptidase [Caldilineae bacterium]